MASNLKQISTKNYALPGITSRDESKACRQHFIKIVRLPGAENDCALNSLLIAPLNYRTSTPGFTRG